MRLASGRQRGTFRASCRAGQCDPRAGQRIGRRIGLDDRKARPGVGVEIAAVLSQP